MPDTPLDGPHWSFVLRLYALPGVSEACLLLQDRLGVDVNVLLMSAYAGVERGIALDAGDLNAMDGPVAPWRKEIVAALRQVRRRLKLGPRPAPNTATERLRTQVKSAELLAEQVEMAELAGWLERHAVERFRPPAGVPADVDVGRMLDAVVAHFARIHGASADAATAGEIRNAVETLRQAAESLRADPPG